MKIKIKLSHMEIVEKTFHQTQVSVGRSEKSDFQVKADSLSRLHCQIEFDQGDFYITDLNSANGVFIGEERINPGIRIKYNPVFPLFLGSLECRIEEHEITLTNTKIHLKQFFKKKEIVLEEMLSPKAQVIEVKKRRLRPIPLIAGAILLTTFILFLYKKHELFREGVRNIYRP